MTGPRRHLRAPTGADRSAARIHVTVRTTRAAHSSTSHRSRGTTRMAQEARDAMRIPRIVFPDNETFIASDVDFAALFPTSPPRFSTLKRFACTRCQLSQVPTILFGLPTIAEVNLSGNAINDVPVQFEGRAITTLDLTNNEFVDVPIEIYAMPQLRSLDLSGNRITSCESPASSDASGRAAATAAADGNGLQFLTLDDNPITSFRCRFPTLQTLSLHNTSLTSLPRVLADFTALTRLVVSGNPALRLTADAPSLPTVTELDVSSNGLTRLPPVLDAVTPNLRTLTLAHNNLTDASGANDAFAGSSTLLSNLTTLVLDGNAISTASAVLARFPSLTNLSMAHNGMSEWPSSSSEAVESLRFLNLSGNAFTAFNATLPRLETLDLHNNSLATVSPAIFTLENLQVLDLSANPIEPWELTPAQFRFLSALRTLSIDQTAFASCAVQDQRALHGKLTVCVAPASSDDTSTSPTPTAVPTPDPSRARSGTGTTRASTSDQLLYLGGSFLIAILIALWIFMVRRRRAQAAAAAAAMASSSSASHHRASSSMAPSSSRPSPHGSSALRPLSVDPTKAFRGSSDRRSPVATASYHAPLSSPPGTRDASLHHSTFWEDEELQAWRVEFDGVQPQTKIAVGVFSEVWRARYRTDVVAIKTLKASLRVLHRHHPEMLDTGVLDDFIFEIRVLSRLNHPRIVAFYGAAWTTESELTAIMEYLPQQDLRGFLTQRQPSPSSTHRHSGSGSDRTAADDHDANGSSSSWSIEIVHMALCVAEALTCLHAQEPPLVHGNVQARNVLLDEHMDAKLCDFGSAQYCSIPLLSFSDRCLTSESDEQSSSFSLASVRADATPWIAPEVLRSQAVCDPSIDLYAFGVLLAEIDTNAVPYDDATLNDLEVRRRVAVGALRPTFTATCPLRVLALAMKCLAFEPADRPTSPDVVFELREILTEMERASEASCSTVGTTRSTIGPLLNLQSTDSSVSDSDMSQRTIEFRRYSSA